ncbi:MAG TPA: GNAT family N-acetyltransferase [Candidatus Saccharimonadales bacterium]|nr:GNAT family N-acetyltransferase [Candidatus Saccharimonadales bacterium]
MTNTENIVLKQLSREYAEENAERLAVIASEIPGTSWTSEMVMAEEVPGESKQVPLLGKWRHSLVMEESEVPIALAIGYEVRNKDEISQALHLGALACDRAYKGRKLGEHLLARFLKNAIERGYVALSDTTMTFSLQTGADPENVSVRHLYEKYGFVADHEIVKPDGVKNVVMIARQDDVERAVTSNKDLV